MKSRGQVTGSVTGKRPATVDISGKSGVSVSRQPSTNLDLDMLQSTDNKKESFTEEIREKFEDADLKRIRSRYEFSK